MKVVIENSTVSVRSGSTNGRDWTIRTQSARVVSDLWAGPIEIQLSDGQDPYSPGEYQLDLERSVRIGSFGRLEITRTLHLTAVSKTASVQFPKTGTAG